MLRERGLQQRGGLKGEVVARLAEPTPDNDDEMMPPAAAAAVGDASRAATRKAARATLERERCDRIKSNQGNLKPKIEKLFAVRPHHTKRRAAGGGAADDAGGAGDRDDNAEPLKITAAWLERAQTLQDVLDYLKEKGEREYPPPQVLSVDEKRENKSKSHEWKHALKKKRDVEKKARQRGHEKIMGEGLQQVADMLEAEAAAAEG